MSKPFQFKKFTVAQDNCAMKIGTDGVLLGAWASVAHAPETILDIGAGTGIIALMLAQRSTAQLVDAVEIEDNAFVQAVENFERSPWGDRLFCYHASFEEFAEEMKGEVQYDLIVANPPFYTDQFSSGDAKRDQARFSKALPKENLLKGVSELLAETGKFNLIIPYQEESVLLELAQSYHLYPHRLTRVKGDKNSPVKRSLCEFGLDHKTFDIEELIIEDTRHRYTPEYVQLVKEFYLKM